MVAILLARSYQDLTFNSQDVSAFYLSQIYRINAGSSGSTAPLPVNVPDPSTSSPAISIVWVNALWSLSLVMSIACTLFATLLQQWARRYLRTTQEPRGSRNRARIRELMVRGIEVAIFPDGPSLTCNDSSLHLPIPRQPSYFLGHTRKRYSLCSAIPIYQPVSDPPV